MAGSPSEHLLELTRCSAAASYTHGTGENVGCCDGNKLNQGQYYGSVPKTASGLAVSGMLMATAIDLK